MKRVPTIMLLVCMHVAAIVSAQGITLSEKNVPLQRIFSSIEKQTGKTFYYNDALLARTEKISISVTNASLDEVLNLCFKNLPITYEIIGKTIVLKEKKTITINTDNTSLSGVSFAGVVVGEDGSPMEGLTVTVKGTKKGIATNSLGAFLLPDIKIGDVLILSGINIETQEAAVKEYTNKKTILRQVATKQN